MRWFSKIVIALLYIKIIFKYKKLVSASKVADNNDKFIRYQKFGLKYYYSKKKNF